MSDRELGCEEVIERLFDFLDHRLDGGQDDAIHRHLERCRECFSRAEFERRLRERVAEAGTEQAPERLRRRIRTVLDEF